MPEKIRWFRRQKAGETAAADLLRECGEKLTDRALWQQFQQRFQGLIFLYLMRALRLNRIQEDVADIVPDLAQEVYLRLVQNDGRILRSYRGTTEFSVMAFLARISSSVVQDYQRAANSEKRRGQVIPIDSLRASELQGASSGSPATDANHWNTVARLMDVEKAIAGDPDRKNARRNVLIFKLHHVDGFQASEISRFPGFGLSKSGVETILSRLKKRFEA
jgi:RNA polymerase sigma factor (sigma-70 family)